MFVRWKRRLRKSVARRRRRFPSQEPSRYLLSAVLVRSARQGGKVRQKVVCYLGCIEEGNTAKIASREHFWAAVDRHLNTLGLDPAERKKVEERLLATVTRPTADELTELTEFRRAVVAACTLRGRR